MYMIKFVLTIQITLMTVIIYIYIELLIQLYVVFEGKIKAAKPRWLKAKQTNSFSHMVILLAFGYVANR